MSFLGSPVDVVGLYNNDFGQFLGTARPTKASVYEGAKMFTQPLESADSIIDHRIILPIEIDIVFWLHPEEYFRLYQQFKKLFLDGTPIMVKTRTGVYSNMVMSEMPHQEKPQIADALFLEVSFQELQTLTSQSSTFSPTNPAFSNTVDRGLIQSIVSNLDIPTSLNLSAIDLNFGSFI